MSFFSGPPGPPGGSSIQEQRQRWERKCTRTTKELVKTEQRYCEQLELVSTFFVEILKAKGTLKTDIRESIFSSVKELHLLHQSLLVHLENGYVGQGFQQFCPHLSVYNTYVDNIYNSSKVLQIQLKKNKAFRRFKVLQEERPELRSQKLEDLLQLPLLRMDQYKHFLQDLAANTSPDSPEFQHISMALERVCDVSLRIEKNARHHDNHLQLCRVQKLLRGRKIKVMAAGRWFHREGWLSVVPSKGSELSFPKASLLLMSNNQEDLNDWYHSLSSAVRKLQSLTEENRRPLTSDPESNNTPNRKRTMVSADCTEHAQTAAAEWENSAPKRMKQRAAAEHSDPPSSSCVIL